MSIVFAVVALVLVLALVAFGIYRGTKHLNTVYQTLRRFL